ncbi:heterokaryon incompatibility protein-domain-containing protein [Leptodontidium sp. 2 PMI_412]|nr:heterokaryon incompatibility protein-domain-containing protein [Leptodontidium sp. 2 PMI_412]
MPQDSSYSGAPYSPYHRSHPDRVPWDFVRNAPPEGSHRSYPDRVPWDFVRNAPPEGPHDHTSQNQPSQSYFAPSQWSEDESHGDSSEAATAGHMLRLRLQKSLHISTELTQSGDNFFTPKNDFFYSKSPYMPLHSGRHEIRLLRVHSRKSYAEHLHIHPGWAPIDTKTQKPWNIQQRDLGELFSAHPYLNIPDLKTPVLACEILDQTALSRIKKYNVLSYCAGDPKQTSLILVDGVPFNAFANLEHAIHVVSEHWSREYPDEPLLLWADQICINQRDRPERTSQVQLMREIYRRGARTFVCLDTHGSRNCLGWTGTDDEPFNIAHLQQRLERELCLTEWQPGFPSPKAHWPRKTDKRAGKSKEVRQTATAKTSSFLTSLYECFQSPWWRRAWVYQELVLSPHPYFISTAACISWDEVLPYLQWICWDVQPRLYYDLLPRKDEILSEWAAQDDERLKTAKQKGEEEEMQKYDDKLREYEIQEKDLGRKYQKHKYTCKSLPFCRCGYNASSHWRTGKPIKPDPWSTNAPLLQRTKNAWQAEKDKVWDERYKLSTLDLSAVRSMIEGKTRKGHKATLLSLLQHSTVCQASDPRDRVYAFLGLADSGHGIVPDYSPSNTLVHVLISTTKAVISQSKTLDIFSHASRRCDKLAMFLPTWVPDWTAPPQKQMLETYIAENPVATPFDASAGRITKATYHQEPGSGEHVQLRTRGIKVGSLDTYTNPSASGIEVGYWELDSRDDVLVIAAESAIVGDEVFVLFGAKKPVLLRSERNGIYSFWNEVLLLDTKYNYSDIMYGALCREKDDVQEAGQNLSIV